MTDGLSRLPVNALPQVPRHAFGEPRFVKADPKKGRPHNQTERACPCGVVKCTVFGDDGAWREWRLPGSPDQYSDAMGTPPCSLGAK